MTLKPSAAASSCAVLIGQKSPTPRSAAPTNQHCRKRQSRDRPRIGHEFIRVVEDIGSEVSTVRNGDLVVVPFA